MSNLGEHDVFIFIAQLGVIIFIARLCGEVAKRLGQPILAGEVTAGILLGPTVFGKFAPQWHEALFPSSGISGYLLQGVSWLCALFLLLITGLEIDFRASLQYGKQNILTSFFGFLFPFLLIFNFTQFLPSDFYPPDMSPLYVNLLLATALSVASVPVISKILFDLKIFHSNVGLNIITSSVLSDVWEWSTLLVVIALITHGGISLVIAAKPIVVMFIFLGVALTMGRRIIAKIFRWLQIQPKDTTAVLAVLFSLTLLNGAIAHLIGIHVVFGAFLTGLMVGESDRITPHMRQSIQDFIFGVFAPIFFVSIGRQLQFSGLEDWFYLLSLVVIASVGKIGGAFFGALFGGIGRKNAFAVGCGLNAQGAMGIVVALIGSEMGVFNEKMFSTVVIISVLSSLLVGPSLKWAIKAVRRPLADFFSREHIFIGLDGKDKHGVIRGMVKRMAERKIIENPRNIKKAIWQREVSLSTAIGEGVALPHARIPNLKAPIVCFFKLKNPVDFGSPDNVPVQFVFLELTDSNDQGMQLNLIAQISRFLSSVGNRKRLFECRTEEEIHHVLSFDETV